MFLSRLLTPAEKNYWATELEISCIVWAVRKLRHFIEAAPEGLDPVIYTDHIATIALATSLSTSAPERLNLRLVRGAQYLQQFRLKVCHRSGVSNRIADALSRLPAANPTLPRHDDDLDALHASPAEDTYALLASAVQLYPSSIFALIVFSPQQEKRGDSLEESRASCRQDF